MSNKKPVLTVVIRDHREFSAEEFCTAVATAVLWFVDEVNTGYSHAKHEVALRNWELTGRRISIRLASEEQWWYFLMADGMTDRVGDIYFHVCPPMPTHELPDFIRYCPDDDFKPSDEFEIEPRQTDIRLPLFSIVLKENKKVGLTDYAKKAADTALVYLHEIMASKEGYDDWSKSNFALNVGIAPDLNPVSEPDLMMLERSPRKVSAMGLWVE